MERRTKRTSQKLNFRSRKCINSHALLREIEKHQVLYNRQHIGFTSKSAKQLVWIEISRALFPDYDHSNAKMQLTMRNAVNRRWKTLRDGLVRALKDWDQRPERMKTPQMKAMTFLIPHMTHGSNYSLKSDCNPDAEGNDIVIVNVPITETDYDSKPSDTESFGDISYNEYSKNKNCYESEDDIVSVISTGDEMDFEEYATAQAHNTHTQKLVEIHSIDCQPIQEIIQPLVKQEIDENISVHSDNEIQRPNNEIQPSDNEIQPPVLNKAPVTEMADNPMPNGNCSGKYVTVNSDIFELVQKSALDAQDEDRMFLLSLLSDFKRVLPENRLKVKLKIVQAMADGL